VLQEERSATQLAKLLGASLAVVNFQVPCQFGTGEIRGRNAFFVMAALMACELQSGVIALGIHAGTRYYDCTPAFLESIDRLTAEYTDGRVRTIAPFISWSKGDIFDYYVRAGLPTQLTYSCEAGTEPPCGKCASCRDRKALGCFP
jgi:7-cyano-7-deazaguanine synthase